MNRRVENHVYSIIFLNINLHHQQDNIIRYKFTPNEKFEKNLQLSYKGVDILDKKLDENLGQRISSTYKELFQ